MNTNETTEGGLSTRNLRRMIVEQSFLSGVGHIGSSLSIADIIVALFKGGVIKPDKDTFVLSKGHAALAYYCALNLLGTIDRPTLATYCRDDSHLGVHPDIGGPDVLFATGSLGHGLSMSTGMALANRLNDTDGRSFVLISDAELNEGSTWEALLFAGHQKLGSLIAILDNNGQQALAPTKDVIDLSNIDKVLPLLGWEVISIDGHSVEELERTLRAKTAGKPRFVIANTVSGKGVSFMEQKVAWHYLPLNEDQYHRALAEIA